MALNIKSHEADQLARELAQKTGTSITEAVVAALREKLQREQGRARVRSLAEELMAIGRRCAALPDLDKRSLEEIIDYDEVGLPR